MHKLALFCFLILGSAPAMAIYRCDTGGKTIYSDKPCPGGRTIDIQDNGSPAASDAAQRAAREKAELRQLQEASRKEETARQREQAGSAKADAARRKRCQALAMRQKWSEEDASAASLKASEKAKRKARRNAEKYEVECGRQAW
jgi:Domain of unknown function (DUF4124)